MRISYRYAGIAAWALACFAGFCGLTFYDTTPGAAASSSYSVEPSREARLYVFLHPQCPCSLATMEELQHLLVEYGKPVRVFVVFSGPMAKQGQNSELGQLALKLPGASLTIDESANLAQKMSAKTSGQVIYFDAQGRMLFAGGVTASRSHVGSNRGSDLLLQRIRGEDNSMATNPVFGCGLF